jgi:hypothetical protein
MKTKLMALNALKKLDAELRSAWAARTLPAGVISTDSIVGLSRVIAALEADIAKPVEPVGVLYQIKLHVDSEETWRDATQRAYDYTLEKSRRIVYTTPQEPAPDSPERQLERHNDYVAGFDEATKRAAVPAGWKLVLVEPTNSQAKAAADAFLDCNSKLMLNKALAAVRAGIAAAPAAPGGAA